MSKFDEEMHFRSMCMFLCLPTIGSMLRVVSFHGPPGANSSLPGLAVGSAIASVELIFN